MNKQKIFRGLAGTTASLLAISLAGTSIAASRESFLNSRLGTSSYKLVDTGDGSGSSYYFQSEFESLADLVAAKNELAEQISEEGSVLFKNLDGALPINKETEKVTLWGLNSHTPTLGGMIGSTAAAAVDKGQKAYGIEEALAEKGFDVNQEMIALYSGEEAAAYLRKGFGGGGETGHGLIPGFAPTWEAPAAYMVGEAPASIYTDEVLRSADDTAAVVVISRDNSEAADYEPFMVNLTEGDSFERPLALSDYERQMIQLAKEHSTKVIVLLNADNPIEIEELKQDEEIDAVMWVGLPGINGFLGVADVLSGEVSPSGKIADTYAVNSASSPAMVNFGVNMYEGNTQDSSPVLTEGDKADWFVVEGEGIYSGYKYYETRYEDTVLGQGNAKDAAGSSTGSEWDYTAEISYPFGYGLSYTTFEQKLESVDVQVGEPGKAVVSVENTGDVAGKSVVQVYVQTPYTEGGVEKSAIQLIGIGKTEELEPGASQTLEIEIDPTYFASYDETAEKEDGTTGAWILDEGDYYFAIGNGAHEALNNVLAEKLGEEDGLAAITEDEEVNPDGVLVWSLKEKDVETYSAGVQNALQEADINYYIEDAVEYTTRSDWTKGWTTISSLPITEEMKPGLTNSRNALTENSDSEVLWGQDNGLKLLDGMIMEDGKYAGVLDIEDEFWEKLTNQVTLDEAIQFIAYGGDDIENIDSIFLPRTYMNDGPLGFAFDQVAGYATRWSEDLKEDPCYVSADHENAGTSMASMPTEPVVAATFNQELVKREGELTGEDALWSNESIIIAPGVNLHRAPYCARNHEYYSEDAMLTALLSSSMCTGAQSKGLMTQMKHYAFNHQETNRAGVSTFLNEQGARENELRGFQKAMSENLTGSVMTAFNRVGTDYAGGFEGTLKQIARTEWQYTGAFVTDLINGAEYMNWRDIVFGGGGIALTETAYAEAKIGLMEASKDAIAKDAVFQQEMHDGIKYWLYNLAQSNALNGISSTSEVQKVTQWWKTALYSATAITAVLTLLFVFLSLKSGKKAGEKAEGGAKK